MKSSSFALDERLYVLLQQEGRTQFTTAELRDAYAKALEGTHFRLSDVRRYVYTQIRRMIRAGLLMPDEERRSRGQVFHLQPFPAHLKLELTASGFQQSPKTSSEPNTAPSAADERSASLAPGSDAKQHLEVLLKEIRLDFLSSMGEAERFKQLIDDLPSLKEKVEGEYVEARDRSSRLLGHLRAIEKTLKTLAPSR